MFGIIKQKMTIVEGRLSPKEEIIYSLGINVTVSIYRSGSRAAQSLDVEGCIIFDSTECDEKRELLLQLTKLYL